MKLFHCVPLLIAAVLGLMLPDAMAQSDSFSWQNITYAPTSASAAAADTTLGNSTDNTNTLSTQIVLSNSATFSTLAQSPNSAANSDSTNIYATSGTATQRSLQLVMDYTANTDFATVTLFFSQPVANLSFKLFDVDSGTINGGGYTDVIRSIEGLPAAGGSAVGLMSVGGSQDNAVTGSGLTAQAYGTASNAQTANLGDVTVTFGSTPIKEFSFVYGDNYTIPNGGAHSVVQIVALSNLTFTDVPEPGTVALFCVGFAVAASAFARHRK